MITRLLAVSSATLSLLALTVLPVSAASLTSDTSAVAGTPTAGVSVGVSGSATSNTGTSNTGTSGSATVTTGTQGTSGSNTTTGSDTSGTSGSVTTNGTTATSGDDSSSVSLSDTDQAVTGFTDNGSVSASDASSVTTHDQLNSFAAGTMHNDSNIKDVQLSNSTVAMTYKQPGHFLGFIPVTVSAHAQVNADGTVTVTHPWYDFLTATNDSAVRTSIQTQLQQSMSDMASTSSSGGMTFSPSMQAQLMAEMHTAFTDSSK